MYPVRLGFSTAKSRINKLLENGHDAEALLTSVFTFEKIIHRTLKQLVISSGFRSKDAENLLKQVQGFNKQKEIWSCFDPNHKSLPDVIGNQHWQNINTAVRMRNALVHGKRVFNLSECRDITQNMISLLDQAVSSFNNEYGYDGWSVIRSRQISKLHTDPKVKIKA